MTHPPIGIDLGTTNSLISVFRNSAPELIPNALGNVLTPSVVSLDADRVLVGDAARDRLATHPDQTAHAFKRAMGTGSVIKLGTQKFSAVDLSALVLRRLKEDAEMHLGTTIRDVVVSVPAYFNQAQRQATQDACAVAGLNAVRLVNEPTAAALAYGLQDRDGESQFLVFDLGGGTFDVTILEHFDGVMEVKSSSGDAHLGGEDFTDALAKWMCDQLGYVWAKLSRDDQRVLRIQAERGKRLLTGEAEVALTLGLATGEQALTLTREGFEEATKTLRKRLMRPVERCFYDGLVNAEDLDRVILVGGATRMPMIRQVVGRTLKHLPEAHINPDHAVALGAAVQAGLVAEDRALDDVVMTDVTPFSVGIATAQKLETGVVLGGYFDPVIERNTALPVSREKIYGLIEDNLREVKLPIYQGEAPKVEDNVKLGEVQVKLGRRKAKEDAVRVRITYDISGLIQIDTTTVADGNEASLVIDQNVKGMSEAEISKQLIAMKKLKLHPREDEENLALLARLRRIFEMTSGGDRHALREHLIGFEAALNDQDTKRIEKLRGDLNTLLDEIDDYYVT